MKRPPGPTGRSILMSRPVSESINRVSRKHKELADLRLSPERARVVENWVRTEFVHSTLMLDDLAVERSRIEELLASSSVEPRSAHEPAARLIEGLRTIDDLVRRGGRTAALTPDLLLKLHDPGEHREPTLRAGAGLGARIPQPVAPERLRTAIEVACRWFTAESFAELNPVEQSAIVFLRLVEIQPFEEANERTSLVAAGLFTMRTDLPPLIIRKDRESAYRAAIDEGLRMNTLPFVELAAEALEASLAEMLAVARQD